MLAGSNTKISGIEMKLKSSRRGGAVTVRPNGARRFRRNGATLG